MGIAPSEDVTTARGGAVKATRTTRRAESNSILRQVTCSLSAGGRMQRYMHRSTGVHRHSALLLIPVMTVWTAPKWVHTLYAQFPLVVLDQEDELPRDPGPSMWVRSQRAICLSTSQAHPRSLPVPATAHGHPQIQNV